MSALNDESRVKFLKFFLIHGKSCVCELEESFSMLQPRISRHLKILKDAGFLVSSQEGVRVYYEIKPSSHLQQRLLEEINLLNLDIPHKIGACDI